MIPAADCKHSQISMDDSFYLTNIVPQDIYNNAGYIHTVSMRYRRYVHSYTHTHTQHPRTQHPHNTHNTHIHMHAHTHYTHIHTCTNTTNICSYWNRLEMFCRDLTADYDEVRVISGPLFLPEEDKDSGKSFVKYEVS